MKKIIYVFAVVFLMATVCAYAAQPKIEFSGFLDNYPEFESGPKGGVQLVYSKENVDFSVYKKIMLDHVVFYFKDDAKYKGINPDELKMLADAFHQAVVDALGDVYILVDEPGPDVLRIRCAITDVVPSKPGKNTLSTILPVGLIRSSIKKAKTGIHANVGQAAMEVEILDSLTNERIAAAIDRRGGKKAKIAQGAKKWGHTKGIFNQWAKRLRIWLDGVH